MRELLRIRKRRIPPSVSRSAKYNAPMGNDGPLLPRSYKFPFLFCLLKAINLITK